VGSNPIVSLANFFGLLITSAPNDNATLDIFGLSVDTTVRLTNLDFL